MLDTIKKRINLVTAYFSTLYFCEIIFMMFGLLLVYGKTISVIAGFTLSTLLAVQIVMVFYRKNRNRKIQLFVMDFHIAYSFSFLANTLLYGFDSNPATAAMIIVRLLILLIEVPLAYFLTDEDVITAFA
ncbi:MAG: hypothetical protein MUD12_02440 [Spirochaetes bacterium]|jgi:hypothetical protein|nr:hypothetical protein [Spirochaetota bacterium]